MDTYEQEIINILDSIKKTEYNDIKERQEKKKNIIDAVFERYRFYKKNIENKKIIENELEAYELVDDISILKKGDNIRCLNLRYFYDIKLMGQYYIVNIDYENGGNIIMKNGEYVKTIKNNKHIMFRKLKNDLLVKSKLINIVEGL